MESPQVATISSSAPLIATTDTLPTSNQERATITADSNYAARISALITQADMNHRDPFRYQMFNANINYVSNDVDEEDMDVPQATNDDSPVALAALDSSDIAPHDEFYLDPSLASNVARLPSPTNQQNEDDESSIESSSIDTSTSKGIVKTDRSGETTASSLLSIKTLLSKDNSFFLDDGDALMKVISSAINFGAPPNLMSLYTNGHISKCQLLNFLRLESRRWYSPPSQQPGASPACPIDLTADDSHDNNDYDHPIIIDDPLSPVLAASTNQLGQDPSPTLRESSSPPSTPARSNPPSDLAPQFRNGFDGRNLNSFST